ncbi:PQQ-binding-like beta-propeller repeat protein [Mycolicibacterium setense]|uniref:outer membrane protein assembly factor BamB family protein n=1 Tax=Mycolicibacterium setense TaxID=431269 RepID=UPI0012FF033D|nr:PQQ-binding-like beta-propeller repeat protein [Mycolicibacterium setense]MCV7109684.1 PQQ-binding-like beta-propeller repeat protein [Mycolicibacterium setense]
MTRNDTTSTDDEHRAAVTWAGRLAIALAVGLTLGAVGLAVYAYAARVPAGQTATYLAPASQLLLVSLICMCVAGAATIWLGARAVAGLDTAGHASLLLAGTVAIAAYGLLSAKPPLHRMLISGPDARPVIVIAQVSWLVLAGAAVLLLAGATSASANRARRPGRAALAVSTACGVTIAVVAGLAVTSLSSVGASSATTAARVPIPAVPTSVGTNVAYRVKVDEQGVRPAGPGFVGITDRAVVSFDGSTGAQRWRFPTADLPERCGDVTVWSTGIGDDAVVVVQCTRPPNTLEPDRYSPAGDDRVAFLVGLDASTGEQLWLNDADWHLRGRANGDGDILAAVSTDKIGALDPRTGKPLWARDRPDDDCGRSRYDAVGSTLIIVDPCGDALHAYDAESEYTIDFTKQPGFPSGDVDTEWLAVDGGVVAVYASGINSVDGVLLSVDVETKAVQVTPEPFVRTPDLEKSLPGPVVELGKDGRARTVTLYVPAERREVRATGVAMSADPRAQRWARVGDEFVTAAAYQDNFDEVLATVPAIGGQATLRPNPCHRAGGVMPVPGAVLALCANHSDRGEVNGYDVLGLR